MLTRLPKHTTSNIHYVFLFHPTELFLLVVDGLSLLGGLSIQHPINIHCVFLFHHTEPSVTVVDGLYLPDSLSIQHPSNIHYVFLFHPTTLSVCVKPFEVFLRKAFF